MINCSPTNYLGYLGKAEALEKMGKYEESLETYDFIIKSFSEPQSLYGKGRVLIYLGRNEEAIEAFNESLKVKPNNIGVILTKADCLMRMQKFDDCIDIYKVRNYLNNK